MFYILYKKYIKISTAGIEPATEGPTIPRSTN